MALVPSPAELRDRIRAERRVGQENVGGVVQSSWAPIGVDRSARIVTRLGGETATAARQTSRQLVEITLRSDSDTRRIQTDDRLVDVRGMVNDSIVETTRIWTVLSIGEVEGGLNRWLNLLCETGGRDGR